MPTKPRDTANFLQRGRDKAREQIMRTVKTRYFPEIWYAIENWFQLVKGRQVLEVGYGLGLVAEAMAKSGWQVTIADPSEHALNELRGRFDVATLEGVFEQADVDTLPFAKDSFDAVVAINTLEFSASAANTAREIARVLKPGGRAVIATFNKLSPWGLPLVTQVLRPEDGRRHAQLLTKGELTRILKASGLNVSDIKERANFLPGVGAKLKLPVPGAYVALVTKN